MRSGMPWRTAVLASLALLLTGQLCMLTTCVPRLLRQRGVSAHACCRTTPVAPARSSSSPGPMPCDTMLHGATAPSLAAATPLSLPAALAVAAAVMPAPPAHVAAPFGETDTGPPHERLSPAPAGARAPPQA